MEDRLKSFYKELGGNLKKARKAKGLTQTQVAKILNKGVATVSDNERGITEIPFSVIIEYCKLYGVDIETITPKF